MSGQHIPGPWFYGQESADPEWYIVTIKGGLIVANVNAHHHQEANARLIAAAPDLLEAATLLEKAEEAHANCDECGGEEVPELCPKCFPLFDDARLKRRAAIAKAEGRAP
jgi:hypothetical protein